MKFIHAAHLVIYRPTKGLLGIIRDYCSLECKLCNFYCMIIDKMQQKVLDSMKRN